MTVDETGIIHLNGNRFAAIEDKIQSYTVLKVFALDFESLIDKVLYDGLCPGDFQLSDLFVLQRLLLEFVMELLFHIPFKYMKQSYTSGMPNKGSAAEPSLFGGNNSLPNTLTATIFQ